MKKVFFIIGISTLFFLNSCSEENNDTSPINHIKEQNNTIEHHEHNHNTAEKLTLNGDKKWEINKEMKPFLLDEESILNDYIIQNTGDYKNLAQQLSDKNNQLIKSCTMEGKSHDELHKWLHPHIDLLNELAEAETIEKADELIEELKTSFSTFHQYFQ